MYSKFDIIKAVIMKAVLSYEYHKLYILGGNT